MASRDPLTAAVSEVLWPYLKTIGFRKRTPRRFARERNETFQHVWVDANGWGGKTSTLIILCATFPFGAVNSYMDPHGFRICNDRRWDTSTHDSARLAMREIVDVLQATELDKLDQLVSPEVMLSKLQGPWSGWFPQTYALLKRWRANDNEVVAMVGANRRALAL
jgi:hypothetical protein